MRRHLLLLPLLAAACARADPGPDRAAVAPLTLAPMAADFAADCVFAPDLDAPPLLVVRQERARARGEVRLAGDVVELTGTAIGDAADLPGGAQLEGAGLTVAVRPDPVPGVPVGAGGVRRPATLTAATADGGEATLSGVWSCGGGAA